MPPKRKGTNSSKQPCRDEKRSAEGTARADLVALFRLLLREPLPDHDFKTCPICKRYGITRI
jgi:hypothetical protein